ncbi:metal dependent phosphohydrolase [Deinococcus proteolyticus MRP]|uniref:bis(5'-nucleosyl)-tetraphosphatase (symmetrical) n=1 Tax=Deinococcus proteolyticus (strain ATCC 35074 / DSM 20540 / JCM 6276 / NBRC 101906 / NCIMB 13154 / VKM Ac-1939 / CCM 2703 / MRP) TaxID=693977 RepID=F0RNS4_DEIPM|nr:metal dependent phosphohydrolase [Deinococcus proteolyticus MRP]
MASAPYLLDGLALQVARPQAIATPATETPLCSNLGELPQPAAAPQDLPAWMTAEWPRWAGEVQARVNPTRWEHVKRVALLAAQIAYAAGLDTRRAYAAGILHDLARDFGGEELLQLAPPECDLDERWPLAVHGRAARRALEALGFTDPVVLDAVEDHVTGPRPGHAVSACVYIADVSEPGRGVNSDIRELALQAPGAALAQAIGSKVRYLSGRGTEVHPRTLALYRWLEQEGHIPWAGETPA